MESGKMAGETLLRLFEQLIATVMLSSKTKAKLMIHC
jgi:hypothetical protein